MDYLIHGMVSALRHGVVTPDQTFFDLQNACDEPDIHELEDITLGEMLEMWETAKKVHAAERGVS